MDTLFHLLVVFTLTFSSVRSLGIYEDLPYDCTPPLDVGDFGNGGWPIVITKPDGCPCKYLRLDMSNNDLSDKPSKTDRVWEKVNSWLSTNKTNITSDIYIRGWYRTICCRDLYFCKYADGTSEPIWLHGMDTEKWNVSVMIIQPPGVPRMIIKVIQHKEAGAEDFFFPKLKLRIYGPSELDYFYIRELNFPNNTWQECTVSDTVSDEGGLLPGYYRIEIEPAYGVKLPCTYHDECPTLWTDHTIVASRFIASPLNEEKKIWSYPIGIIGVLRVLLNMSISLYNKLV